MFVVKIKSVHEHKRLSTVLADNEESIDVRLLLHSYYHMLYIAVHTLKAGFTGNVSTSILTIRLTKFTERLKLLEKSTIFIV